ncbi:hypothetical protein [Frondihabitans peucedani]|uniref:Centromere-binding protein ParB C-terminal domain-containing protein n=1 Tax=Frondihabitans peucedani TaxID=598626 RepID=A0ABP8E317_9MICO
MSDTSNRSIGAPPPIRRSGGAASLIRENRPIQPAEAPEVSGEATPERSITGPPPAPRIAVQQTIASAPEPDLKQAVAPEPAIPVTEDAPSAAPAASIAPSLPATTATAPASTPWTRKKGAAPAVESPDDIIKVTFEIRRGDRDAFNAAFAMASAREFYTSPKEILQRIYNAETKRIEDAYNDGQPFPLRKKQAPRGTPIQPRG